MSGRFQLIGQDELAAVLGISLNPTTDVWEIPTRVHPPATTVGDGAVSIPPLMSGKFQR